MEILPCCGAVRGQGLIVIAGGNFLAGPETRTKLMELRFIQAWRAASGTNNLISIFAILFSIKNANMGKNDITLDHQEIWDDSALVDSWNQALEEYKVSL